MLYKPWFEYEPDQTMDYAVNLGLTKSKTNHNKGYFNTVSYHGQLHIYG